MPIPKRRPHGQANDRDAGRGGGVPGWHRHREVPADPGGDRPGGLVPAAAGGRHHDRGRRGAVAGHARRHRHGGRRAGRHGERRPARHRRGDHLRLRAHGRGGRRAWCASTRARSRRSSPPPRRSATWRALNLERAQRPAPTRASSPRPTTTASRPSTSRRRPGWARSAPPSSARRSARRSRASWASAR